MHDEPGQAKKSWRRRAFEFLISFLLFIAVGKVFETLGDKDSIRAAYNLQQEWIATVKLMSPGGLAETYMEETLESGHPQRGFRECIRSCPGNVCNRLPDDCERLDRFDIATHERCQLLRHAYNECEADFSSKHFSCVKACEAKNPAHPLFLPMYTLFGGLAGTGVALWNAGNIFVLIQLVLAVLAFAALMRVWGPFIFSGPLAFVSVPLAIIGMGSAIAFIFKYAMLAALYILSPITGLAAAAAGSSGVVGVCWFCLTKIGEKSTEHVLTENIKL